MYLLSILVFLVLCIVFMINVTGIGSTGIIYFIDMPTIIMLIMLVIPMIVIAGLLKDFNNAFRFGTKMKKPVKKAELSRALEAVSLAIKAFWTAGIFTFLVPTGSVLIKNSGNLNLSLTISYIAVGLLPLCYASAFAIVLLPLKSRLKVRLDAFCEENIIVEDGAVQDTNQKREDCGPEKTE